MLKLKLKYTIRGLILPDDDLCFELILIHRIRIRLTKPNSEYLEKSKNNEIVFCTAELEIEPSLKNTNIFENIINNRIVKNTQELNSYTEFTDHNKQKIVIPNLEYFPEHFTSFIKQLAAELTDSIKQTVNNLRWVLDKKGLHNPFSHNSFVFTLNDKHWYPVPTSISVEIESLSPNIVIAKKDNDIIKELLQKNIQEPIYHSLHREAWELRSSNPRSALIIAISSVEISVKQLIQNANPESEWLVQNLPTPPIIIILQEYISKLPIKNRINNNKILLPSEEMISNLKKWITQRNKMVHSGKGNLKGEKLKEMLLSVKDILHIIDFNIGHIWALNHIRVETKEKLGIK
jgi:hypothetical protein